MLLAALAVAFVLRQAPPLELRVAGAWTPWRAFAPGARAEPDPLLAGVIAWRDSLPGLRLGTFEVRTARRWLENRIAVIEIDPARYAFALAAAPGFARRRAEEWLTDPSVVLAVNTGLFRRNGAPEGLVMMDGTLRSAATGWLDAVVAIEDGRAQLTTLAGVRGLGSRASAFQTLPWLVRDGVVTLGVTSGVRLSRTHRDRRLTLCLGGEGLVRLLLSNFEVFGHDAGSIPVGLTIPEQATIAAAAGCRDAVALDGGISAQIVLRGRDRLRRMPGWRRVPLMMVLRRR